VNWEGYEGGKFLDLFIVMQKHLPEATEERHDKAHCYT
jgi:hypothetical protein